MNHEVEEDSKEFIGKFENSSERFMIHKSNSSNLEQDIKLAFEVKKYPSLYDKRDHGYKRNDPSMESWALVANACDWIPNGKKLFSIIFLLTFHLFFLSITVFHTKQISLKKMGLIFLLCLAFLKAFIPSGLNLHSKSSFKIQNLPPFLYCTYFQNIFFNL